MLTCEETAVRLGIGMKTLVNYRALGIGPVPERNPRNGRPIGYTIAEVEKALKNGRRWKVLAES
jgi:hypothetical protein